MPQIRVLLKRDGTVDMEGFDFTGPACAERIRAYLERLGAVTSATPKPEYYVQEDIQALEGRA